MVPNNLNRNVKKHEELDSYLHLCEQSFADDTKLGGMLESPAVCVAVQWDLNRMEKITVEQKGNVKFCTWGGISSMYQETLREALGEAAL